jgi:hypothetical protein
VYFADWLEEVEYHWKQFEAKLSSVYDKRNEDLHGEDDQDVVELHIRPHLDEIRRVLLEEDREILKEPGEGGIGDCIEFAMRKNFVVDLVSFAQSDHPKGMFELCVDFLTCVCGKVRSLQIMHNDRVHRQLLQLVKFLSDSISNDIIEVNSSSFDVESKRRVSVLLDFVNMVISTALNSDRELTKFFIEETSKVQEKYRAYLSEEDLSGAQTFVPLKLLLEFLKRE